MTKVTYGELLEQIQEIQDTASLPDYRALIYWFVENVFGLEKKKIVTVYRSEVPFVNLPQHMTKTGQNERGTS